MAALGVLGAGAVGCVHVPVNPGDGLPPPSPVIAVPPPGTVPVELRKQTLPPYVIEPPDQLLIEVVIRSTTKDENGRDKETIIPLPIQTVSGSFQVRIDGSVGLGFWGSLPLAGLTLEQASDSIRQHLAQNQALKEYGTKPDRIVVIVDVLAYNSKRYYVITDGGGAGEQVFPFPVTGSETVLDAISNIYGLPSVASKRNIWVARRCPHAGHPWQILPVDWIGITQHGITQTNYQIMPGDRVYVKAQKIVTIDTTLARILSPIERLFGITLLGANTVNQIKGNVGTSSGS
jgi:polysaccharide export outer membrane protein